MNKLIAIGVFAGLFLTVQAELWMPSIFSDGMVLQRDRLVPVWGKADPGTEVTVEFAGQTKRAVADSSKQWKVILDPLSVSSKPQKLTVSCNQQSKFANLNFSNVFVGEVWILAGQSNMGWMLSQSKGGAQAIAQADYPWLRFFKQDPFRKGVCDKPAEDVTDGRWLACTPETAGGISGVGFFFARALGPHLDGVPVALISTESGGTYTECWVDFQTLKKTPSAFPYLEKAAKEMIAGASNSATYYWGENNYRRPSGLFNCMVAPLQSFAVRGVLWYQGEGNTQNWLASGQAETLTALISSWRRGFEQPEMPFLIVQLPRYNAGSGNNWPMVRAAQAQVAKELPNVGLAVTIDCSEKKEIHPVDKRPVGERLALLAQAKVYGQSVAFSGPVFKTFEKSGNALLLQFDYSDGLYLDGTGGFEICGADGRFVPAMPEVVNNEVKISSPEVAEPVGARYGWFNWGEISLFNTAGLPAAPFTSNIP